MEQLTLFENQKKSTDWKWWFKDYPAEKNGLTVFSFFSGGGGSTMGYKLAGCDVLGNCEIDKRMNEVYVKNHNPKYNYEMDIRDFNNLPDNDIPKELFNLDILDGSPPCTTFSLTGLREQTWGKEKKFREGQKKQVLDELSFIFIETAKKLKPKTVIMENVEGLLMGKAWEYVQRIYHDFNEIGYTVRHWLLKGAKMGVPQRRHRCMFIAIRKDINFDISTLDLYFNYEPINYSDIRCGKTVIESVKHTKMFDIFQKAVYGEHKLSETYYRIAGVPNKYFSEAIVYDNEVLPTLVSGHSRYWTFEHKGAVPTEDWISSQTFPQDFDFCTDSNHSCVYILGMSVPPIMIKRVVDSLIEQGVYDYKLKKER